MATWIRTKAGTMINIDHCATIYVRQQLGGNHEVVAGWAGPEGGVSVLASGFGSKEDAQYRMDQLIKHTPADEEVEF